MRRAGTGETGFFRLSAALAAALLFTLSAPGPARSAPALVVEPNEFDVGIVEGDTTVAIRYILKNAGTEPLRITEIRPSCGCTMISLADSLLSPGRSAPLAGTFSTRKIEGPVVKTIILTTNDPARPRAVLLLKGWVQRALTLDRTTVRFPDAAPGEMLEETVLLRPGRGHDLSELKIEADPHLFRHYVTDGEREGDRLLHITLLPQKEAMMIDRAVTVRTAIEGRELTEIRVLAHIQGKK